MTDALILAAVAALMLFAVRGAIKHFKGESPCCGGGAALAKEAAAKPLHGPVIGRKTIKISGMHCERCARRVAEAINKIDGASAKVSLKEGAASVSYDRELDDEALRRAVKEAGCEAAEINS